jgi:hypothetical protein
VQGIGGDQNSSVPSWQNGSKVSSIVTHKKICAAFNRPIVWMDVPIQRVGDFTGGVIAIFMKSAIKPMSL